MNNDLMQKLAISKKIMDASDRIKPGQAQPSLPMTENTNINATYNIPQDMLESQVPQQPKMPQVPTQDRIVNSKLPDEIKKLMIEHPIQQPEFNGGGPVLSNEVIEGAARLMGRDNQSVSENKTSVSTTSNSDLKQMIRDVVRDTVRDVVKEELQNAGLLSESSQNTNETLSLRVGKHIFEGKVTKIKKVK